MEYDPEVTGFRVVKERNGKQESMLIPKGEASDRFIQDITNPEIMKKLLAQKRTSELESGKPTIVPDGAAVLKNGKLIYENVKDGGFETKVVPLGEDRGSAVLKTNKRTGEAELFYPESDGSGGSRLSKTGLAISKEIWDNIEKMDGYAKPNPMGGGSMVMPEGVQLAAKAVGLQEYYKPDDETSLKPAQAVALAAQLEKGGATTRTAMFRVNGKETPFTVMVDKGGNVYPIGPATGGGRRAGTAPTAQGSGTQPIQPAERTGPPVPSNAEILGVSEDDAKAVMKHLGPIPTDAEGRDAYVMRARAAVTAANENADRLRGRVRDEMSFDPNYNVGLRPLPRVNAQPPGVRP
jgi:hypothetical protein